MSSGPGTLKKMWPRDPNMRELIESLWREYYGLYTEKYNRDPEKWLLNKFSEDIEFGQAIGQDHDIKGNQSAALGIGAIINSFRELALGSYAKDTEALSAEEWNVLDLLFALGNGTDAVNRSNAIEVYKSGLIKLFNAIKIGDYEHGEEDPENGMIKYNENGLFLRHQDRWTSLIDNYINEIPIGDVDGTNRIFTTSYAYVQDSISVFVNGLKETHFVETNDTSVMMENALKNIGFTDSIEVTYIKK